MLYWGRSFALVSIRKEKLWIPSKLIKLQFEKKKPFEKEKWQLIHRDDNPQVVRKPHKGWGKDSVLVCSRKCPTSKTQETLDIWSLKKKRWLSRKSQQARRTLIYDTNILNRVKSHYLDLHISLLVNTMVVATHLKIKAGFGVGRWLSSKSDHVVRRRLQSFCLISGAICYGKEGR